MATEAEHMLADFGAALAGAGTVTDIDGDPVLCFVGPLESLYSEFERATLHRQNIYHLLGAIDEKSVGQIIEVDGERWTVNSHRAAKFSACLSVERSSG